MRQTIARWESRGGKYFANLYRDSYGYGYRALDAAGYFGNITEAEALELIEHRLPVLQADANVTPMRRVEIRDLPAHGTPPADGIYRADDGSLVRVHHGRPEPL